MKDFMLESLRDEQNTLMRLLEVGRRAYVAEVTLLDYALEVVVTAWRELRADVIDWQEAARRYQLATNIELECQTAVTAEQLPIRLEYLGNDQ